MNGPPKIFLSSYFEENSKKGCGLLFRLYYRAMCTHAVRFVYSREVVEDLDSPEQIMRAEALNEVQGPNQESINLINQVRTRAAVAVIKLADFASKENLRDYLLKERGWEFFAEGKRRDDQIRMGNFISSAVTRGKNAQPFHVLYPLPQSEVEANPNLKRNDGY